MKLIFSALMVLGVLGLCLAVRKRNVRWCTTSPLENAKCSQFRSHMRRVGGPFVTCVLKSSHFQCIQTIAENKADAVTLDSSLLYLAGQPPYNLRPVVAEVYGTKAEPQTHYYAVAVARKGTNFQLNNLRGVKSCHTGLNRMAGWTVPLGTLHSFLNWNGPPEPLQKAVSEFFSASCVPCADGKMYPKLCQLCSGTRENKCACSSVEPYFGYSGALQCLTDRVGDVAFVRGRTVLGKIREKNAAVIAFYWILILALALLASFYIKLS